MEMVIFKTRKKYYFLASLVIFLSLIALLFFKIPSHRIRIPIIFTSSGTPAILATIEEKSYLLQLDLGSKFLLTLEKEILENIRDKKSTELAQWRDAKGDFYESPSYIISQVKIENILLKNVKVNQENSNFRANTTLWDDHPQGSVSTNRYLGNLGRPLLEKTNLLLDFRNSTMIACSNEKYLKKEGFFLDKMVSIPFNGGTKGIIIKADTDAGTLRLALDTGATVTFVRASCLKDQKCTKEKRGFLTFTSQKFLIGNKDFGSTNLFLFDITPELTEIDGILGMDFLKNHVVYIDYKNKVLYFGESKHQKDF